MPIMLWTLQLYIFREMGKTFLLTAIGLMVILGLGGGIMNMIELDQVTTWQMIKLMVFVLPVALALTLPIAALFAAATTYGRLSADNEFVACRSGGINIFTLFAPSLVISLASATITFAFISFVIPGLIKNLNALIQADLEQIVVQGLKKPGGFPLVSDRYRIFADRTAVQVDPDNPSNKHVRLDGVTFVETDGDEWVRSGTAGTVVLSFDVTGDQPTVAGDMYGVSLIDHRKGQSAEVPEHQPLGPYPIPRRFRAKVKWLDLKELAYYRRHPDEWSKMREQVDRVRALACGSRFYERTVSEFLDRGGCVRLGDESVTFELRADEVRQDSHDGRTHFGGHVQILEQSDQGRRTISSDRAVLIVDPGRDLAHTKAHIRVFDNVTMSDPTDQSKGIRKQRATLDVFGIDPALVAEIGAIPGDVLLHDATLFDPGSDAERKRRRAVELRGEIVRDIDGVIHSRFAFSVSVFVLVILAAALGIIFRGAHVLTAFGIAFVPTLFVIVIIVMGRQMADKPDTAVIGLAVLWSGIVIVGGLDAWVLTRVLRR